MKAVKHKPTMAPIQCDHCQRIWYGIFCSDEKRIVPVGKTLCSECWNELDKYMYKIQSKEYLEIDDLRRGISEEGPGWKRNFPQFFHISGKWIEDTTKKPFRKKLKYSPSVPKWVRMAIDAGKMVPNDSYVYIVTTCGDHLMQVEKTMDKSGLRQHYA